jgi:YHS domain-containing protein
MTATPLLRCAVVVLLASCQQKSDCSTCDHDKQPVVARSTKATLEPWQTFSDKFAGCAGGCGMRATGPTDGVATQPVMAGQYTYCLVSGVVFQTQIQSARRTVGAKTFYFCCEACAQFFTENQAAVLAARGIAA